MYATYSWIAFGGVGSLFMAFHKLKFKPNYFISEAGYVFKITNGKEEVLKAHKKQHSVNPYVFIDKKPYDLLYLMIEYFGLTVKPTDSVRYSTDKDNFIQLGSIKIRHAHITDGFSDEEAKEIIRYKCEEKARSANIRCEFKISPIDVYNVLKVYNFSCVYCSINLINRVWHLDHVTALSKNGKNKVENIVPSCPRCNLMKGAMDGLEFIAHCKKVGEKTVITNM